MCPAEPSRNQALERLSNDLLRCITENIFRAFVKEDDFLRFVHAHNGVGRDGDDSRQYRIIYQIGHFVWPRGIPYLGIEGMRRTLHNVPDRAIQRAPVAYSVARNLTGKQRSENTSMSN